MTAPRSRSDPADSDSLAAVLQNNSIVQNTISEWLSSPTRDIHAQLVTFNTLPSGQVPTPSLFSSSYPLSISLHSTSSMAPALIHQSNASTHPPSLCNFSDVTPTETSVNTDLVSQFSGVPVLEEVNGVLERRPNQIKAPMYECAFWFLSCSYVSDNQEEWEMHCLSHFRSEEPPTSVQCPLCEWKGKDDNGWTAWDLRMHHMASSHVLFGGTLKTSRPDFPLFKHLWQKRLIDEQDLKELMGGNHNLDHLPSNFTSTNHRRERERRRPLPRRQHIGPRQPGIGPSQTTAVPV